MGDRKIMIVDDDLQLVLGLMPGRRRQRHDRRRPRRLLPNPIAEPALRLPGYRLQPVQPANDIWTVGPGLALPLFEGGLRNAEEQAALAAYRQAAANYRETVLAAFQQVEDALSQQRLLATEMQQEAAAVNAARQTVTMTTNLYKDGATDFLDVVVAQTAELQAEQTLVDLRTRA